MAAARSRAGACPYGSLPLASAARGLISGHRPARLRWAIPFNLLSRGIRQAANPPMIASSSPVTEHLSSERNVVEGVKHVLEMAMNALSRREVLHTDFLTPPVIKGSISAVEKLSDVKAVIHGGYPQAERCRISVGYSGAMKEVPDVVAALSISGNYSFKPFCHGDFLGAILGTGIVRDKVGDILIQGQKGAQVLVVSELVDFLLSAINKVGDVPVSCAQIPLLALEYEPQRTKVLTTVESSLRVDALASAGFKISRTKLASLISNGDVRVNWFPVLKSGATLKTGDIISVSGKGKLKVGEISTTRKGRFTVELICYL